MIKEVMSLTTSVAALVVMSAIFSVIVVTRSKRLAMLNHKINVWVQKQ